MLEATAASDCRAVSRGRRLPMLAAAAAWAKQRRELAGLAAAEPEQRNSALRQQQDRPTQVAAVAADMA